MNIYAVRTNNNIYQILDMEVNDFIDDFPDSITYRQAHEFSSENIAMAEFWQTVKTGFAELEGSENIVPDICKWIDATLLLSPKAYRLLGDLLKPYGEFLPVVVEDKTYYIFNCLTMADVVESETTENNLVFDESLVGNKLVFKTPYQGYIDIFCSERLKDMIESSGLCGVQFDTKLFSPYLG